MKVFRDQFFWVSYGKFAVVVVLGFGAVSLLGVAPEVAVRLAAGAIIGFPAAYSLSRRRHPDCHPERLARKAR